MKNQSEKQKLASHRNWFKFKIAGNFEQNKVFSLLNNISFQQIN